MMMHMGRKETRHIESECQWNIYAMLSPIDHLAEKYGYVKQFEGCITNKGYGVNTCTRISSSPITRKPKRKRPHKTVTETKSGDKVPIKYMRNIIGPSWVWEQCKICFIKLSNPHDLQNHYIAVHGIQLASVTDKDKENEKTTLQESVTPVTVGNKENEETAQQEIGTTTEETALRESGTENEKTALQENVTPITVENKENEETALHEIGTETEETALQESGTENEKTALQESVTPITVGNKVYERTTLRESGFVPEVKECKLVSDAQPIPVTNFKQTIDNGRVWNSYWCVICQSKLKKNEDLRKHYLKKHKLRQSVITLGTSAFETEVTVSLRGDQVEIVSRQSESYDSAVVDGGDEDYVQMYAMDTEDGTV